MSATITFDLPAKLRRGDDLLRSASHPSSPESVVLARRDELRRARRGNPLMTMTMATKDKPDQRASVPCPAHIMGGHAPEKEARLTRGTFVRASKAGTLGAARSTSFSSWVVGAPLLEARGHDASVGALARGRGGCPRPARPRSDFGKRS